MEIWVDVKDYEGIYQISNLGRIKTLPRIKRNFNINTKQLEEIMLPEKIRKPQLTRYGYYRIGLTKNHKQIYYSVHRLVAEAFIPNPENLPQINHKDENKLNNCVSNLEWCTARYNANYGTRNKRTGEPQMKKIRCVETNTVYKSLSEASRVTEINIGNLSSVCNGKVGYKTAGGYHWEYIKPERKTRRKKVIE